MPGSSIKGVLRSQAERIVRTVRGSDPLPGWNNLKARDRHLKQVDVQIVGEVFGMAKKRKPKQGDQHHANDQVSGSKGNRGALEVSTCYANDARMGPGRWREIAMAKSDEGDQRPGLSPLYQAIQNAGLLQANPPAPQPYFQQAYHVAVDRWTGGAAQGLLYSTLEPFSVQWDEIVLTLDLDFLNSRIPDADPDADNEQKQQVEQRRDQLCKAAVALLLLLLRDLARNRIPLGFAGNRGYGSIKVTGVTVTAENVAWFNNVTLANLAHGSFDGVDAQQLKPIEDAWKAWINENQNSKVKT
jgi:CRISPR/Cas system CSM-associated protein Csm3 (group 7 of RAMP superfamily)